MSKKAISVKITLDIKKDAWNWWNACNSSSHGVDWKERISKDLQEKIVGKSQKEAEIFLNTYLKDLYKKEHSKIKKYVSITETTFDEKLQIGCNKVELAMGKPIYRRNFIIYITTFPRAPYNLKTGSIWLPFLDKDPMGTFLHELCHFQFIHYWWRNDPAVKRLSREQFELLKESLTIILDEDFLDVIKKPDEGYPNHQKLRAKLRKNWKKFHDFDKLVKYAL